MADWKLLNTIVFQMTATHKNKIYEHIIIQYLYSDDVDKICFRSIMLPVLVWYLCTFVTGPAKTGHVGTQFLPTFSIFLNL